jgi:putative salt-induced outer membrane protein
MRSFYFLIYFLFLFSLPALSAEPASPWKNESQAGVVLTSGNTRNTTLNATQATSYEFDANLLKFSGSYLFQKSAGVNTGKYWSVGLRYERALSEKFSLFFGQTVEGDKFKGISQRYNSDLGAKYFLVKADDLNWFFEGGYRLTKENARNRKRTLQYARAYTEIEKKWSATFSTKYWLEALPNFTESDDWQLNTELSASAALNSVFSFKTAYLLKYDNQVNSVGIVKSDRVTTASLIAKF